MITHIRFLLPLQKMVLYEEEKRLAAAHVVVSEKVRLLFVLMSAVALTWLILSLHLFLSLVRSGRM
jgi:hypothetical protein